MEKQILKLSEGIWFVARVHNSDGRSAVFSISFVSEDVVFMFCNGTFQQ